MEKFVTHPVLGSSKAPLPQRLSPVTPDAPPRQGTTASMTSHQTWLITGCSSGLGREIALAALSRGDRVVATARQTSDLDYLEGEKGALILQLDVCAPENVLREKTDSMIASIGPIDVLVNNAGFVAAGVWEELR